jgi:hypothetical protein
VYQLACPDCDMRYVGQMGRPFWVRFAKHLRDFKYNNDKSKFAMHLIENNHAIGPISDVMTILCRANKGRLMGTIKKFHI